MDYRLHITEHAQDQLDQHICYLLYQLHSIQAARHLIHGISDIYGRLEQNPLQFPYCPDIYLARRGYREALVTDMNYLVLFRIDDHVVNVVAIHHQTENYADKA